MDDFCQSQINYYQKQLLTIVLKYVNTRLNKVFLQILIQPVLFAITKSSLFVKLVFI